MSTIESCARQNNKRRSVRLSQERRTRLTLCVHRRAERSGLGSAPVLCLRTRRVRRCELSTWNSRRQIGQRTGEKPQKKQHERTNHQQLQGGKSHNLPRPDS